jgi:hypothetical protein
MIFTSFDFIYWVYRIGWRHIEHRIAWMNEHTNWWRNTTTLTNHVTGIATIYVHMDCGNVSSTGEFTDTRLEALV